jgi:hypothetical protein
MRPLRALVLLLLAVPATSPRPVHAAPAASGFCGVASQNLKVGSWATYRVTDRQGQATTMRFAALPGKPVDGVEHVWVEMRMEIVPGTNMVTQVLVPGFPYESGAIKEMVMQSDPGTPPMRMPAEMLAHMAAMGGQQNPADVACGAMQKVGTETIRVPAGTFVADHYRNTRASGDSWVSAVGPNGIAFLKATFPNGAMELTGSGTGAVSSFTMAPQ